MSRHTASRRQGSQYQFSQVPSVQIQRSSFDRSHFHKTTFDSGYLVPFYVDEALPGDSFRLNARLFARLATPIVPVMDNAWIDTFYFAVPLRLVWDNFQRFMGEQDDPDDSTDYLVPQVDLPSDLRTPGSIHDYFGIPTGDQIYPDIQVSALFHRAYNLIYNEWFRSEDLQDSVPVPRDDGIDSGHNYTLLRRTKRHDYFTSALPWPQKGPGVELPITGMAPIVNAPEFLTNNEIWTSATAQNPAAWRSLQAQRSTGSGRALVSEVANNDVVGDLLDAEYRVEFPQDLMADLGSTQAVTINAMRQAFQMQRMMEKDARGGTRYTEIIRNHFRVISPDARLQRPEYLGGNSTPIQMQSVPQTSAQDGQPTPQGNLAAFSQTLSERNGFTKSFTEHTIIIGLLNVRANLTYQQGLNRMWSRKTKFDFYWPSLAHLGEQAILNKEIYCDGSPEDEDAFGYQERWSEYRYKPSMITGKLRSTDSASLDVWHLAQEFDSRPLLNSEFIEENAPFDRVIAVPTEPQFILDSYIDLRTARPMPLYSVPGLIDHF